MIRKILNMFNGVMSHWSVNFLSQRDLRINRLRAINDQELKNVAEISLVASLSLIEEFFGPERSKQSSLTNISNQKIKTLKKKDFNNMIIIINEMFLNLMTVRNRYIEFSVVDIMKQLHNKTFVRDDFQPIKTSDDFKKTIFHYSDKFFENSRIIDADDPLLTIFFFNLTNTILEQIEMKNTIFK